MASVQKTLDLLQRIKSLTGVQAEWFDSLCAWYSYTRLTKRVIEQLVVEDHPLDVLALTVNDRPLEDARGEMDYYSFRVSWMLPPRLLKPGENLIAIRLSPRARMPLRVRGAAVEPEREGTRESLDFTVAEPKPTAHFGLAFSSETRFGDAHWIVQREGFLLFRVQLRSLADVGLHLHLVDSGWRESAKEVMSKVIKVVREKRKEWEARKRKAEQAGDPNLPTINQNIEDLTSYEVLHSVQIERAFEGDSSQTLDEIIRETGQPDDFIRTRQVPDYPEVTLANPQPAYTPATPATSSPPANPARPPRRPREEMPRSRGGCVRTLFLLGSLAGLGYLGWVNQDAILESVRNVLPGRPQAAEINQFLTKVKANTGDVRVALYWKTKNDLDLHVVAPSGDTIFFGNRQSRCGGNLDVDMNVGLAGAQIPAVEHVFWPLGKAPKGKYQVFVNHFSNHGKAPGCTDPTDFTVLVNLRGVETVMPGRVASGQKVLVHEFTVN